MSPTEHSKERTSYAAGISRRDSLKLLAALASSTLLAPLSGCNKASEPVAPLAPGSATPNQAHWPDLKLSPITASGYGTDPNLIVPPSAPWPLTLSPSQLTLLAVLCDLLIPKEGAGSSASEAAVPTVLDEWVSAPYQTQQADRVMLLSLLQWFDDEAKLRFTLPSFVAISSNQQTAILDDIAFDTSDPRFTRPNQAFARLRQLAVAAYFCTEQGSKELGYVGNVPIAGDYPGPSHEAYQHLHLQLASLGLTEFAYTTA